MMHREHLTLSEAASYLDITERSINNLIREGKLKAYRPNGKRVYIYRRDIDEFIINGQIEVKEAI
jgi:excisionase family DNA binding protein